MNENSTASTLRRHEKYDRLIAAAKKLEPIATAVIFADGPTRTGSMMPSSAASIAPRKEDWSHGCTTIVTPRCASFARPIRRSYFEPGAGAPGLSGTIVSIPPVCSRMSSPGIYCVASVMVVPLTGPPPRPFH